MTAELLLWDMSVRGVVLVPNGERLDVEAPDEILTDDLLATLKAHKAELLALLTRNCGTSSTASNQISAMSSGKAMVLAALEQGRCPDCDNRLDLQSRQNSGVYWCSICREHFTVSDWLN